MNNIQLINDDCRNVKPSEDNIIVVSDPPFNMKYHYNSYKDNLSDKEYDDLMISIFGKFPSVVIHYPEYLYKLSSLINKVPLKVVSWVYNSNTAKQHRDIAFFDVKPDFSKVRQPYKNLNDKRIKERIARGCVGAKLYDWWEINQIKNVSKEKTAHPCQMPLEVMKRIVGILPDDVTIYDPFMGSGTTAVACKELNRNFIGCEIDETYFNIAQQRIACINVDGGGYLIIELPNSNCVEYVMLLIRYNTLIVLECYIAVSIAP